MPMFMLHAHVHVSWTDRPTDRKNRQPDSQPTSQPACQHKSKKRDKTQTDAVLMLLLAFFCFVLSLLVTKNCHEIQNRDGTVTAKTVTEPVFVIKPMENQEKRENQNRDGTVTTVTKP